MKKSTILIISISIIILFTIFYLLLFQCAAPLQKRLPKGVPIKADGGGGATLSLSTVPSISDKIILKVEDTTSYPVQVSVDNVIKGTIEGNSYWCEIYDYADPFPSKFIEVNATDPNDPNFNNYHAISILGVGVPFNLSCSIPMGTVNYHSFNFDGGLNGRYYFVDIKVHSTSVTAPQSATLEENIGGSGMNFTVEGRKIRFINVNASNTIEYKLTHINGNSVDIIVYYME